MNDIQDAKAELSRVQLESYQHEYDDLVDSWKSLETKAQGTVAIAGVFLAAVFAFVRDLKPGSSLTLAWSLIAAVVFLAAAVGAAVGSLRIRKIPRPPLGDDTSRLVSDLLALDGRDTTKRIPLLYNDLCGRWKHVNTEVANASKSKAGWIFAAQLMLFIAVLIVGFITLGTVAAAANLKGIP